jgi:hypothetical protein
MDAFEKELIEAVEQRSDVWRDARCGKFTSSEIWRLMVEPRSKNADWSETAIGYIHTKVAEELSGVVHQASNAYPLVWGEEQEPFARELFMKKTGLQVEVTGFKMLNNHYGGSPDGIVESEKSIIEIKCPFNSANFVDYLLTTEITEQNYREYYWQMQSNMLITSSELCYFIAYDPRFPDNMQLKIIKVKRNNEAIDRLLDKLPKAITLKMDLVNEIKNSL